MTVAGWSLIAFCAIESSDWRVALRGTRTHSNSAAQRLGHELFSIAHSQGAPLLISSNMKTIQLYYSTQMLTGGLGQPGQRDTLLVPGMRRGLPGQEEAVDRDAKLERRGKPLTLREWEVLQLIAEGKPNKQTASELSISIKTVEKHRGKLMEKLGIQGTAGLTRYAITVGLVPCSP